MAPEQAARVRHKVAAESAVLTPEEDEAYVREAGFCYLQKFYMLFVFREPVTCMCMRQHSNQKIVKYVFCLV